MREAELDKEVNKEVEEGRVGRNGFGYRGWGENGRNFNDRVRQQHHHEGNLRVGGREKQWRK